MKKTKTFISILAALTAFSNNLSLPPRLLLLFALIFCAGASRAANAADAATATAAVPATATAAEPATPQVSFIERESKVIFAQGAAIVVDKGSADGVTQGMAMTVYEIAAATATPETATDTDVPAAPKAAGPRVKVADVTVVDIEEHLSDAIISSQLKPAAKGMIAAYLVPLTAEPVIVQIPLADISCPEEMQAVSGGSFTYRPGGKTLDETMAMKNSTEQTGNFCVDIEPQKKQLPWPGADAFCKAQGKRLCEPVEQHRVCQDYNRKPNCDPKVKAAGNCPRGHTVNNFKGSQEWSAPWTEAEDQPDGTSEVMPKNGSCECIGTTPNCTTCYYPECSGAAKKFRCCKSVQ